MSKYFQVLLVLLYITVSCLAVFWVLSLWGVVLRQTPAILIALGWTLVCFAAGYVLTTVFLFRYHVRKPILAEEMVLNQHVQKVLQRAATFKKIRLLIQEDEGANAFAIGHNTIVLSRGLLDTMEPGELQAVISHELGHLQSKDCIVGTAFVVANAIPQLIRHAWRKAVRLFFKTFHISMRLLNAISAWLGLALMVGLGYLLYTRHLLLPIAGMVVFTVVYAYLSPVFFFLWRMVSRFTEYKQDRFAQRLGYGDELRQALEKLTREAPQAVSLYVILMGSDHPIIYNRIRRLEKLQGVR